MTIIVGAEEVKDPLKFAEAVIAGIWCKFIRNGQEQQLEITPVDSFEANALMKLISQHLKKYQVKK